MAKYARRLTEGVTERSQRTYRQQLQAHFDNGERFTQFEHDMEVYLSVMKPAIVQLRLLERPGSVLSDVPVSFVKLWNTYRNLDIDRELKEFLQKSVKNRFNFIMKTEHIRAFLLDPRYIIEDADTVRFFDANQLIDFRTRLVNFLSANDASKVTSIQRQFTEFEKEKLISKIAIRSTF